MANSCHHCGHAFERPSPFCPQCGTVAAPAPQTEAEPKRKKGWILPVVAISAVCITALWATVIEQGRKQQQLVAATPTPIPSPQNDSERLAVAKQLLTGTHSSADVQTGVNFLKQIPKGAPEYKDAQALIKQGETLYKEQLKAEQDATLIGPKPEVIGDTVWCVDRYLKRNLNDYDSAEYLSWSQPAKVEYKGQPYWAVKLRLRAKNAFGGKIIKDVVFFIRNNQVVDQSGL